MSSWLSIIIRGSAISAFGIGLLHRATASSKNPSIRMLRVLVSALTIRVSSPILRMFRSSHTPNSLDDITTTWLNKVLAKQRNEATIQSFSLEEFDVGKTSKSGRITIHYGTSDNTNNAPKTAIIKMTRIDIEGIILNLVLKLYREGLFYEELAAESQLNIPICYFTSCDSLTGEFCILLEDAAPAEMLATPDDIRQHYTNETWNTNSWSLPLNDLEEMCSMITKQHVQYCSQDTVMRMANTRPWLMFANLIASGGKDLGESNMMHKLFADSWEKTKLESSKGKWISTPWPIEFITLNDEFIDFHLTFIQTCFGVLQSYGLPVTLCHQDFHMWNVLKASNSGKKILLDFQVVGFNFPHCDFGYMIALCLNPVERKKHERALVDKCWVEFCNGCSLDQKKYSKEINWKMYQLFSAIKIFYLIHILVSLMTDGREDDEYIPPLLMARLRDFVKDHGTPKDNWKDLQEMLREE
jgi:hypothetical protein